MSAAAHARDNRVFHYAVLLSIVVHGLLLFAAPFSRNASRGVEAQPAPIAARIVEPPPSPAREAAPEPVKPEPPVSKPIAKPSPRKPVPAKSEVPAPQPAPPPAAEPAAAPAPPSSAPAQSAAVAPSAAAPPTGAQTDADNIGRFRMLVIHEALKHKRYPRAAMDNNWEGRVDVRVQFGGDGRRASIAVARSSGYEVLDRQAIDTITKAFVPVPPALRGKEFTIEIPVIYSLKDALSG